MAIPSSIRRVIAGWLLVVFAFGITPKLTLHNFVADHIDGSGKTTAKHWRGETVNRSSFNCQCDNLVCESAFLPEISYQYTFAAPAFTVHLNGAIASRTFSASLSYGLRGPPAV